MLLDELFSNLSAEVFSLLKWPVKTIAALLRPRREHRKPAQDRYFTSQEAEAEDPTSNTTDSETHLGSSWDEDEEDDAEFDPDEDMEDVEMV